MNMAKEREKEREKAREREKEKEIESEKKKEFNYYLLEIAFGQIKTSKIILKLANEYKPPNISISSERRKELELLNPLKLESIYYTNQPSFLSTITNQLKDNLFSYIVDNLNYKILEKIIKPEYIFSFFNFLQPIGAINIDMLEFSYSKITNKMELFENLHNINNPFIIELVINHYLAIVKDKEKLELYEYFNPDFTKQILKIILPNAPINIFTNILNGKYPDFELKQNLYHLIITSKNKPQLFKLIANNELLSKRFTDLYQPRTVCIGYGNYIKFEKLISVNYNSFCKLNESLKHYGMKYIFNGDSMKNLIKLINDPPKTIEINNNDDEFQKELNSIDQTKKFKFFLKLFRILLVLFINNQIKTLKHKRTKLYDILFKDDLIKISIFKNEIDYLVKENGKDNIKSIVIELFLSKFLPIIYNSAIFCGERSMTDFIVMKLTTQLKIDKMHNTGVYEWGNLSKIEQLNIKYIRKTIINNSFSKLDSQLLKIFFKPEFKSDELLILEDENYLSIIKNSEYSKDFQKYCSFLDGIIQLIKDQNLFNYMDCDGLMEMLIESIVTNFPNLSIKEFDEMVMKIFKNYPNCIGSHPLYSNFELTKHCHSLHSNNFDFVDGYSKFHYFKKEKDNTQLMEFFYKNNLMEVDLYLYGVNNRTSYNFVERNVDPLLSINYLNNFYLDDKKIGINEFVFFFAMESILFNDLKPKCLKICFTLGNNGLENLSDELDSTIFIKKDLNSYWFFHLLFSSKLVIFVDNNQAPTNEERKKNHQITILDYLKLKYLTPKLFNYLDKKLLITASGNLTN